MCLDVASLVQAYMVSFSHCKRRPKIRMHVRQKEPSPRDLKGRRKGQSQHARHWRFPEKHPSHRSPRKQIFQHKAITGFLRAFPQYAFPMTTSRWALRFPLCSHPIPSHPSTSDFKVQGSVLFLLGFTPRERWVWWYRPHPCQMHWKPLLGRMHRPEASYRCSPQSSPLHLFLKRTMCLVMPFSTKIGQSNTNNCP